MKVFLLVKLLQIKLKRIRANYKKNIVEFNEKSRPRTKEGKDKKEILMKMHMIFMEDKN